MSSQAGPVAAWLADREGARLVARPDVVFAAAPRPGAPLAFPGTASAAGFRPVPVGSFLDVHLCAVVTLQSGETLHMGVNATTFAYRQLGQPPGPAARAVCSPPRHGATGACSTGPETPYRSSVLTVHD